MERVDPLPNSTNSGDRPTVVFAGGGTGGHLFPGIAVAEALERRGVSARCLFIGSTRSVERQIVSENGFEHVALPVESSSLLWQSPVRFANRMWKSAQVARRLLPECKAAIVVGMGGFASVPVVWAARQCGIPIVLLEQNAVPGRATSWLSRRAELTCLGFAEAGHRLPARCRHLVTGNPVLFEDRRFGELGSNRRPQPDPLSSGRQPRLGGAQRGICVVCRESAGDLRRLANCASNGSTRHRGDAKTVRIAQAGSPSRPVFR